MWPAVSAAAGTATVRRRQYPVSLGGAFNIVSEVPNSGRGDCLFLSILAALRCDTAANAALASSKAAVEARLAAMCDGLTLAGVSATTLRRMAYCVFLAPHPVTDHVIDRWRVMAADAALRAEYGQAECLHATRRARSMTAAQRTELFLACMNPSTCWGDETAIGVVESVLQLRCVIHDADSGVLTSTPNDTPGAGCASPHLVVPLQKVGMHYQALAISNGRGVHTALAPPAVPDAYRRHVASSPAADAAAAAAFDAHFRRCWALAADAVRPCLRSVAPYVHESRARAEARASDDVPLDGLPCIERLERVADDVSVVRLQCGVAVTRCATSRKRVRS